jgi:serine/threonine protein kinase
VAAQWLHDLGIAHRDLSLENVLVIEGEHGLTVKIIDFGMAVLTRNCWAGCGKKSYKAPEMFNDGKYDPFLSDAFALGVVLFGLHAPRYPWKSTVLGSCKMFEYAYKRGIRALMRKWMVSRTQSLAEAFAEPLVDLLEGLLAMDPERRLTLGERCWGKSRLSVWDIQWLESDD